VSGTETGISPGRAEMEADRPHDGGGYGASRLDAPPPALSSFFSTFHSAFAQI